MAKLIGPLQPYKPTSEKHFDSVKAAHLLNRAGFGGTEDEVKRVLELGPYEAVEWLLDFPDAGAEELSQDDVPDLSSVEGYPKNYREAQQLMRGMTEQERMAYRQKLMRVNREAVLATVAWWVQRMADGPHPLQEKLTLFWHGHFTTSARDERSAHLLWQQNELLRRQAAGNFAQFVLNISRDPAMLDYLNNQQNRKQKPNENYARELMELFTLGIGNYTEKDIKEAARAFTGWGHNGDDFVFRKYDHDNGEKQFFGRRGNLDGHHVIEAILDHRACAPYIAGRLWNFFVYEYPEPEVTQGLGQVLREAKWELRPLLRTMLTSQAFYSDKAIGTQIKSPVQLVVGTSRLLGLELPVGRGLGNALAKMGQVPLEPPNVKGWPGGRAWINTSTLFVRYNTAVRMVDGDNLTGRRTARSGVEISLNGMSGKPAYEIVDAWVARLVQRPIESEKRRILVEAVGEKPTDESVKKMVQLIVSTPDYQLC
ncbi:MAG TPA: DUF1800 domain-containing protein [Tepidisphaeraceae bacterium]|nr:DUF1800 domain-containing protein [Tepidisphaeraceae bacterium]